MTATPSTRSPTANRFHKSMRNRRMARRSWSICIGTRTWRCRGRRGRHASHGRRSNGRLDKRCARGPTQNHRHRTCPRRVRIFWQLTGLASLIVLQTLSLGFHPVLRSNCTLSGFRDPRFLLTAPNGDIFVVESRANRIKTLRDTKGSGKPDDVETFVEHGLNKPFGIAFYPPGNDPQYFVRC